MEFKRFFLNYKIGGGWVSGLGSMINPELAYYDLEKGKYLNKRFTGKFEVLNLTGNAAYLGKNLVLHIHITLSGRDYKVFGGHLIDGKVGGTLEVFLNAVSGTKRLKKKLDSATGLTLLY
ncbi:MAG: DNA-binding protein [Candidatus Harrisonbacteria bacterium]|nr:DNA-binding protein [Candidatus Harrisonbacteria bacterium]